MLGKVGGWISRFSARISQVVAAIFIILLGVIMTLVVILHYNGITTFGATEVIEFMMISLGFTSLAYTQLRKRHVLLDIIVLKLSKKTQATLYCITSSVSLAFFALLSWRLFLLSYDHWVDKSYTYGPVNLYYWPWYFIALLGCFLLIIVLITDFAQSVVSKLQLAKAQGK